MKLISIQTISLYINLYSQFPRKKASFLEEKVLKLRMTLSETEMTKQPSIFSSACACMHACVCGWINLINPQLQPLRILLLSTSQHYWSTPMYGDLI